MGQRFFRLAAVNILANLTVPLAGLVDTAMLGHLDRIEFLAGFALASVLFDYLYWGCGFLRMGCTGTTAQAVGRGDREEAHVVLQRYMLSAAVLSGFVLVLQVPARELGFAVLAGAEEVKTAGREYYDARIWGAPAVLANFVFLGWFIGRAEARRSLFITATANLGNVALNYVFIFRMGWAAYGAGLATALSQYLALGVSLIFFFRTKIHRPGWRRLLDAGAIRGLLGLNRDIFIRTLCLISVFGAFTNISSLLGVSVLAANTILIRLLNSAAIGIDGLAYAMETMGGILWGKRDGKELRRLLITGLLAAEAIAVLLLIFPILFPRQLYGVMTVHVEVIDTAERFGLWLVPTLLIGALAYIYDGLFIGWTQGRVLRNSMLISMLVFFAPPAVLALLWESNHLLWFAMALFMAARTVTLGLATGHLIGKGGSAGHFSSGS